MAVPKSGDKPKGQSCVGWVKIVQRGRPAPQDSRTARCRESNRLSAVGSVTHFLRARDAVNGGLRQGWRMIGNGLAGAVSDRESCAGCGWGFVFRAELATFGGMDPISHVLLGATLGYAGFGKKLGRSAALAGGLAAFVPDADIFIRSATDPLLAIEYHRGFTHALVFAPVGATLVASLWMLRRRWRPHAFAIWLCCLVAYVSHCLLDAATSYGTQLFWPFSQARAGWDLISIIDPIFTLALLVGLIAALVWRKTVAAGVALSFCAFYLLLGGVQNSRAAAAQRHLAEQRGHRIERFEVMPTLANNLVWRALYVHDGKIYSDRIRVGWFSGATVVEGWSLPLVTVTDLTAAEQARDQNRSFARFNWFSEGWVARKPTDATVLGDMRYSLSSEAFDPIWGIRFTSPGEATEVEWVNRSRQRQISVSELWAEISGRDARYLKLAEIGTVAPESESGGVGQ
jgi:inner membrane protein